MSRHLHASGAVVSYAPGCVDAAGIELLELPNLMPSSGQASTCMSAAALALGLAAPTEAARPNNKVDVVSQQADCSHAEHAGVYLNLGLSLQLHVTCSWAPSSQYLYAYIVCRFMPRHACKMRSCLMAAGQPGHPASWMHASPCGGSN